MFKQILILIAVSVVALIFLQEVELFLSYVGYLHTYLSKHLAQIFAGGDIGITIRHTVVMVLIPLIIGDDELLHLIARWSQGVLGDATLLEVVFQWTESPV